MLLAELTSGGPMSLAGDSRSWLVRALRRTSTDAIVQQRTRDKRGMESDPDQRVADWELTALCGWRL